MINQNDSIENTQFAKVIKELRLGELLRKSNITKNCGIPAFEVFQFLLRLSARVTSAFDMLTRPERVKVFIARTWLVGWLQLHPLGVQHGLPRSR